MMSTILSEMDERLVEIKVLVCDILELEQEEVTPTSLSRKSMALIRFEQLKFWRRWRSASQSRYPSPRWPRW